MVKGIRSFLHDKLRLTKALHLTGRRIKGMLSEASRLSNRILEAGPADQRAILLDVIKHIEVRQDLVSIILCAQTLRAILGQGQPEREPANEKTRGKDEYRLDLPVKFKRRGVEMKLVITDDRKQLWVPKIHAALRM